MSEQQNGLSEAVQKGLQTASTVRGAVKTGKAIAGAAKGASVGGAAGAAIGFAWENRKALTAIIIGCVALLLLPVVIISMLPSLVFGGLDNADALNNPSAVTQNIEELNESVNRVLSESLGCVLEEIETDRQFYEEEVTTVVNPYAEGFSGQITEIIAEYCAFKKEDPQSCSKENLESLLQEGSDALFFYEKTEQESTEESAITVVDAETGETQTQILTETVKTYTYTVGYRGSPFELTEEQKALARDYAENLKNFIEYGV